MIEEPPQSKPGEKGFYLVTNADIFRQVEKLDGDMRNLKQSFKIIGYVIMPTVSTLITLFVNTLF